MVDSKCPRTRRGVVCRPRGGAEVETERGEKRAWDAPRERECNTKHVKGRASTVLVSAESAFREGFTAAFRLFEKYLPSYESTTL
jgi:hypothetical protein